MMMSGLFVTLSNFVFAIFNSSLVSINISFAQNVMVTCERSEIMGTLLFSGDVYRRPLEPV